VGKADTSVDIEKIMEEGTLIDEAMKQAVRAALRQHKLAGNPVADWRDGKVVWIQPEDIDIGEEAEKRKSTKRLRLPRARSGARVRSSAQRRR